MLVVFFLLNKGISQDPPNKHRIINVFPFAAVDKKVQSLKQGVCNVIK